MGQVVLIENNPQLEKIYALNFYVYLALDPTIKKSAAEALPLLDHVDQVSLIVTRLEVGQEETALTLLKKLKEKQLETPLIVVASQIDDKALSERCIHLEVGVDLKTMVQTCAKALGITAKDMAQKVVPEHFSIPLRYFMEIQNPVVEILTQDIETHSFQTQFSPGQVYEPAQIKEMVSMGLTELFVQKDQRLKITNQVTNEMITGLGTEDLTESDKVIAGSTAMDVVSSKMADLGVTGETVAMARKAMKNYTKIAKDVPEVKKFLKTLNKNKGTYLYKHTQMLTYIAVHVLKHVPWYKKEMEPKMIFAAFYHDILLKEDKLAKIHSNEGLQQSGMSNIEKNLVQSHASKVLDLVRRVPKAPEGVDMVIRQHHGTLNGVGFSTNPHMNISPLSLAFIVAEAMVDKILESSEAKFNKKLVVAQLKSQFGAKRFQPIVNSLEKFL